MYIIDIIITPLISLIMLFFLTKLMGYRQVAQLNMSDYITGITFGNIVGNLIMNGLDDYERPLVAMLIYTFFTVAISIITRKSPKIRNFVAGPSLILYENDTLYDKQLAKAKMDIDEFLMQCRLQGYFNLQELDTVVLETNGSFSFYPKEKYRPAQLGDLGVKVQDISYPTLIIKEGKLRHQGLKNINKDKNWLDSTLLAMHVKQEDIILMYQEDNSNIQIFTNTAKQKDFE